MNKNKNIKKQAVKEQAPESGLIAVISGNDPGIYRYATPEQKKMILRENAENRCREFRTEEITKAQEYLQRALDEAEARRFPLGYIAVRSGQFKGVYPYISQEERLKHMNRYHKYEIRDFAHFHFRRIAETWADNISDEDAVTDRTVIHPHLKRIYESGNPARFSGIISKTESNNLIFDKLNIIFSDGTVAENSICIYNHNVASDFKSGDYIEFSAEVYEYITESNSLDYGIYELFDIYTQHNVE